MRSRSAPSARGSAAGAPTSRSSSSPTPPPPASPTPRPSGGSATGSTTSSTAARPTLPWGLQIHEWDQSAGRAVTDAAGHPVVIGTYHPTFLYELVFLLVLATALLVVDRRRRLAPGQLLGLYVAGYPVGRIVVEKMRTDEAERILGQRLNVWTSILVFLLGLWIVWFTGRRAAREAAATTRDDRGARDPAGDARGADEPQSQDVG